MAYIGYISKKLKNELPAVSIILLSYQSLPRNPSNYYHCFYLPIMSSPATPNTKCSATTPQAPTKTRRNTPTDGSLLPTSLLNKFTATDTKRSPSNHRRTNNSVCPGAPKKNNTRQRPVIPLNLDQLPPNAAPHLDTQHDILRLTDMELD